MTQNVPVLPVSTTSPASPRFARFSWHDFRTPTFRTLFRLDRDAAPVIAAIVAALNNAAMFPADAGKACLPDVIGPPFIEGLAPHVFVSGEYDAVTPATTPPVGQHKMASFDRGGKVARLVSNKTLCRLSVGVYDRAIVGFRESATPIRNFCLLQINRPNHRHGLPLPDVDENRYVTYEYIDSARPSKHQHGHLIGRRGVFLSPRYFLLRAAYARVTADAVYYEAEGKRRLRQLDRVPKTGLVGLPGGAREQTAPHATTKQLAFEVECKVSIRGERPEMVSLVSAADLFKAADIAKRQADLLAFHIRFIEAAAIYHGEIRVEDSTPVNPVVDFNWHGGKVYGGKSRRRGFLVESSPVSAVWKTGKNLGFSLRFRTHTVSALSKLNNGNLGVWRDLRSRTPGKPC